VCSHNNCYHDAAICIQYSEQERERVRVCVCVCVCVLALVIWHAKRMHLTILSSVACLVAPYLSTLSYEWHDFQKKVIEHKMCVFIFFTNFAGNISHFMKDSVRYCPVLMKFNFFFDRF
jgi:hypothetical protein